MIPELKPEQQNWTNPFKDIKLTPYRLIAAGGGPRNVVFPDGSILSAGDVKRQLIIRDYLLGMQKRKNY